MSLRNLEKRNFRRIPLNSMFKLQKYDCVYIFPAKLQLSKSYAKGNHTHDELNYIKYTKEYFGEPQYFVMCL
jgi:hypothetical protein